MWKATHGDGTSFYGDSPDTVCSQWYSYVKSVDPVTAGDYTGIKYGQCTSHAPEVGGGQGAGISKIPVRKDIKKSMNNQCGSSPAVVKMKGASFSVICTEKAKNVDFGGSSVGSLGGDSSSNSASSGGSNSNNGGSGASAGGSAGGKGAVGGSSASSAGTASADGKNGGSKGSDGSNSGGGSGSGNGLGNGGSGSSQGSDSGSKGSDGSNSGGGSGSGGGGSEGSADFPDAPDGGGEPDWGGLKSDGGFGSFSPSSAFSTGGYCPQDLVLDFGDFGRHNITLSFVCEAAERLRYVFITLAYFVSAMMIFKTVNSMKG